MIHGKTHAWVGGDGVSDSMLDPSEMGRTACGIDPEANAEWDGTVDRITFLWQRPGRLDTVTCEECRAVCSAFQVIEE